MNKLLIPLSLILLVPSATIMSMEKTHNASVIITSEPFDLSSNEIDAISRFIQEKKASKKSTELKLEMLEFVRKLQLHLQMPRITEYSKAFLNNAITELNDLINPNLSESTFTTVTEAKNNPKESSAILTSKRKSKERRLAELHKEQVKTTEAIAQRSRDENERAAKMAENLRKKKLMLLLEKLLKTWKH